MNGVGTYLAPAKPSLDVTKATGVMRGTPSRVAVRQDGPIVVLFVADKSVQMTTPIAHRVGFALVVNARDCAPAEFVRLTINGESVDFPPRSARQVGGALLRKADGADDWQRSHRRRAAT